MPLIDEGRALGLDLTYDTYPYLAGSTILGMVALPGWVQEGGIDPTVDRLRDPAVRPAEGRVVLDSRRAIPLAASRSPWPRIRTGVGPRG